MEIACGVLSILLIAQQVQIQQLLNKLMSRNYQEFKQAETFKFELPKPPAPPAPDEDLGALDGLGGF